MSVVNSLADAIVSKVGELGALRQVIRFGGPPTPDAIDSVGMLLPGAMVTTVEAGKSDRATNSGRRRRIGLVISIIAKPVPGNTKWANPSAQVWEIEQEVTKLILGNNWGVTGVVPSYDPESIERFPKGILEAGFALLTVEWEQEYDLPGDSADDLNDLQTVVAQADFAHSAPTGSTPPDGVVDHTTQVDGLDT